MSETVSLPAKKRDGTGKGVARRTRISGYTPGVIYGGGVAPETISVELRLLEMETNRPGFYNHDVIDLDVDGQVQKVLCRDVQFHPVTDRPIHIDFLRVSEKTKVTVEIPVVFANEEKSPGLKQGGVLNIVRHAVEVTCRADQIPESLTVDLGTAEIGESIHISAVSVPAGVTPTITDRDFTVVTIVAPTKMATPVAEATEEEGDS